MVAKFLDFIHKSPKYKIVKSFFTILTGFPEIQPGPRQDHDFLRSKITNDDFSQLSFEVYNVCVAKQLRISEFMVNFFLPGPWLLRRPTEAAISTSATSLKGYQILAKVLIFHMRLCLLL